MSALDEDEVTRRFGSPLSVTEPSLPAISPESMRQVAARALGCLERTAPAGVEIALVTDETGLTIKVFGSKDVELLDTIRFWWSDDLDLRLYEVGLIRDLPEYLLTGDRVVKVVPSGGAATKAGGVCGRWLVQWEDRPHDVGDAPPGLVDYLTDEGAE